MIKNDENVQEGQYEKLIFDVSYVYKIDIHRKIFLQLIYFKILEDFSYAPEWSQIHVRTASDVI